jgi:hypothetical protein
LIARGEAGDMGACINSNLQKMTLSGTLLQHWSFGNSYRGVTPKSWLFFCWFRNGIKCFNKQEWVVAPAVVRGLPI